MDNTIIQQGTFTSDGNPYIIKLRSGIDWIQVYNTSVVGGAANPGVMHSAYWQSDMGAGTAYRTVNTDGAATLEYDLSAAPDGFTYFDLSTEAPGAAIAVTAGTDATQPVYDTADTSILADGGIVRITGSAHTNLNGMDFSVDTLVANTSFRLANAIATTPGVVAGAAGYWRFIAPDIDTYKLFYPSRRNIANITQAASAVVTTLVDHGYEVGEVVRFTLPAVYGMIEMNGLSGTVTATTDSTFTVDIDSTGFTAFNFPLPAIVPFTPATVWAIGIDQTESTDGSFFGNQGYIGIRLGEEVVGADTDVIYWRAGKSFNK